ncbi:hypothetical protein KZX49_23945 [Klebsiella quasipneumoniae]|uniref:hypothetical protein n=1 Tax=Klebsiella quasipneumoniae TaxID=1463165 RepID=UPI001C7420D6|nr:hypothetical protein [Klebsiella quasipneumoniae]QYD20977.1 hypothetical protein KZX49_23945 [Klebsiella quasipneumoniae]
MAKLPETPSWESGIHQLEESDRAKAGPGGVLNIATQQLANRTLFLKSQLEGVKDARNLTFYKTSSDPDGTIAGLNATSNGEEFRVAQGVDSTAGFIYYVNVNGVSVPSATIAGSGTIELIKKLATSSEFNETEFRQAAFDASYLWRGHIHEVPVFNSPVPVGIQVTDFSSNSSNASPGRVGISVDGNLHTVIYLPRAGARYIDGVLYSPFSPFRIESCEQWRVAEYNDNTVRIQFTVPGNILSQRPVADSVHGYYDLSGKFAPLSVNEIASATDYAISSTAVLNVFQLVVKTADIVAEGYDHTSPSDVEAFVRTIAKSCLFLGYTGDYVSVSGIEGYFSRWVPAGLISVAPLSGSENQVASITVLNREDKPRAQVSRMEYRSADVLNDTAYSFSNFPVELKVKFGQGEVHANTTLVLTDSSGKKIPAQFSPEWHPNPRSKADMGYYADGSISSGSVFFCDSLIVGQHKFYELNAFASPDVITEPLPNVTPKNVGLSVSFGGYIYDFTSFGGLGAVTTPEGKKYALQVQSWTSGIDAGAIVDKLSNVQFTQRVISRGPVFIEIEQITYNASYDSLSPYTIRHTTRYRIFNNGRIYIRWLHHAAQDIPVNALCGVTHRMIMPDKKLTVDNQRDYSGYLSDPDTGHIITMTLLRSHGDIHRDGTSYGPTRPGYFFAGNPVASATRLQGGWHYLTTTDYSLQNWPVTRDYCWTGEGFIDFESDQSASNDRLTALYNRPVGRFGHPCWPSSVRERLFRRFDDFCTGSMEWFNSAAAASYSGGTSKTKYYQSYTWEIYQYLTKGIGSLDDIYTRFKFRCDNSFGGFDTMGDGYLSGRLVLQFSSRLVVPVYEWLYKAAVREGNTAIISALETSIASYADGIVTRFNTSGGCPLNGSQNAVGNSNSNAVAMRILALAVYMGTDTSGAYQTALNGLNDLLNGPLFNYVKGVLSDEAYSASRAENWLVQANWLHYQAYVANNYLAACDVIGMTPGFDMVNYLLQAQTGFGGFQEIFYGISESRRGSFNTVTFAMYPLIRSGRASAICAAEDLWQQVEEQHNAITGMTKRMYQFNGKTISDDANERYEISFNATVLADMMLRYRFN